jgi:hypothetical protein
MTASNDRNIMKIMIMDQGIILFNAKPRDGIAFLIKNKVIPDETLDIAKFLASTDKLDKHVLGNFLGKDTDFSVAVLNKFASLFHYEGVPFDIALRTFTSRFAMPGESQMIYRILERFSIYYANSNPSIDRDKALILSYALIMLNVDLHSARVKVRMTRDEFVKNTELALGGVVSRSELEDMYYRVSAKEFKPDTTAEEIVYSKLAVNPKYTNKGTKQVDDASAINTLKNGAILLKYGREGNPHPRKVFLSSDGTKICWIDPKKLDKIERRLAYKAAANAPKSGDGSQLSEPKSPVSAPGCIPFVPSPPVLASSPSPQSVNLPHPPPSNITGNDLDILRSTYVKLRARGAQSPESFRREIPLEDISGLVVGSGGTRNFRRHFAETVIEDPETEQRCFSIITDYRTLDLQAPASVDIAPWLHFFHSVLSDREKRLRAAADKNKDIWSFTQKERASLVRWQEIVPQWSDHWNCGARVSAGGGYRASQHPKEELLNHRMFLVNPSGFVLDRGQRLETAVSPQLVALWLEGIPSSVRPRVWPIAVGNNLRIDEKYFYQLLLSVHGEDKKATLASSTPAQLPEFSINPVSMSILESNAGDGGAPSTPNNPVAISLPASSMMFDQLPPAPFNPSSVVATNGDQKPVLKTYGKELERELKSSSMRKFANRALEWIDARGSREQQAFFKPANFDILSLVPTSIVSNARRMSFTAGMKMFASPNSEKQHLPPIASMSDSHLFSEPEASIIRQPSFDSESEEAKSEDSWDSKLSPMNSGWENVYNATKVIVSAFLAHRRDLKYVRGMAVLASMVIFNVGIQDLARAYTVYSNLLHQHYFFDFFTLKWRDLRMRFDLYGKLLKERMPYLDDHFRAIQVTSDLYFNQWLLTGFTRVLPFRTACRVWDGFLLLGESYFFTAALALLNYYEHSLMTSGFSGCLEILLGHADEVLFNDKKFFECVHAQSVSNERFAAWLSAQRLAEEKTALYDLLMLM